MNFQEYSELQQLTSEILTESSYDGPESVGAEKNLLASQGKPGFKAPGYKYGGSRAPDRTNPKKEIPQQQRYAQDLRAASQRSQQRQMQMNSLNPFDVIKGHLLDEGYANDEKSALAIMANMSESWKQSILEMDDFAAGGGNAKMKQTGMSRDQVISLGKKNLAAKPATSSSSSSGRVVGSTPSDVARDRLSSREKYRDSVNKSIAAGVRGPAELLKKQAARKQSDDYDKYMASKPKKTYKSGRDAWNDLAGTSKDK
jgi:hypothetical protein